jgi:hypothetical protein
MTQNHTPTSIPDRLSAAWMFILLTMIFRDLHEFGRPGFLAELQSGIVGGTVINEALMLFGGVLITLPIAMAVLPRFLSRQVNRWANGSVAVLNIALLAPNLANDLDDMYFATLQLIALGFVLWTVMRWRG